MSFMAEWLRVSERLLSMFPRMGWFAAMVMAYNITSFDHYMVEKGDHS